jgi:hypothetical protein
VLVKGLPEQDHTRSAIWALRDPKQNHRVLPDSASLKALALACPKTGNKRGRTAHLARPSVLEAPNHHERSLNVRKNTR